MNKDLVDLYMDQYDRLSDEIGKTMTNRLQIIGVGLATVGLLLGFSLKAMESGGSKTLASVGLYVMVPALCFMTVFLWLSEVRRGRRASWYLWRIERLVNAQMGIRALSWEEDIRTSSDRRLRLFRGHYWTTVAFFWIAGLIAAFCGTQYAGWQTCYSGTYVALLAAISGWAFASQLLFFELYDTESPEWPKPV